MPYGDYKAMEKEKEQVVIKHKTKIHTQVCYVALKSGPEQHLRRKEM